MFLYGFLTNFFRKRWITNIEYVECRFSVVVTRCYHYTKPALNVLNVTNTLDFNNSTLGPVRG